jgi:hypothetical protein
MYNGARRFAAALCDGGERRTDAAGCERHDHHLSSVFLK